MNAEKNETGKISGYAPVNGLRMYYEIEGSGPPLVYIPPVFGYAGMKSFPTLIQGHSIITVDLQGQGRTADLPDRPLSIVQFAKDVVALVKFLGIEKADFFGESYGAATATMIAIQHPEMVRRVATFGGTFGPPTIAINTRMLHFDRPPTADSDSHSFQMAKYREVAPTPEYWPKIWEKVVSIKWEGFSDADLAAVKAPFLIALGDRDFVRLQHAVETLERIPNSELAVIPDAGHFALYSEQERVIPVIVHFLEKPDDRLPVATGEMGFHPGKTR